jgi:hypothetical protein
MASVVGICNRALEKLGGGYIAALSEASKEARALNRAYDYVRDAVLRAHPWNFAIRRASLAPLADAPAWGFAVQYQLPADCLKVIDVDTATRYEIEGRKVLSDQAGSIDIRYVARVTDPNEFDALFAEALAAALAMELAEDLTQSNTKRQLAAQDYANALREARRADGQEGAPLPLADGAWLDSRR